MVHPGGPTTHLRRYVDVPVLRREQGRYVQAQGLGRRGADGVPGCEEGGAHSGRPRGAAHLGQEGVGRAQARRCQAHQQCNRGRLVPLFGVKKRWQ